MSQAYFRFYAELNDFLAIDRRQVTSGFRLNGPVSVKHSIEAYGVPHTEVNLILANGTPVDFSYMVVDEDRIGVYPAFSDIDLGLNLRLRPRLSCPVIFILDGHLGQLATYLRLLGLDADYRTDFEDEELAQRAQDEERVLLTRDVRLLMRKKIVHGYWLRSKDPMEQVQEILQRYQLNEHIKPWHRCLRCNGTLKKVKKEDIMDRLEPLTMKYYHEFHMCQSCDQIYWKGSHYGPLKRIVQEIM
jgi:hypothetical protein